MITLNSSGDTLDSSFVKVRVDPPSGTILLNRPDKRNALNRPMAGQVQRALSDLHLERRVKAVIISGTGSSFCAGTDLAQLEETRRQDDHEKLWHEEAMLFRELLQNLLRFPKPVIAAVNGPAIGLGTGIVLAADIAIGSTEARFGVPEPNRGLVAGFVAPLLAFRLGGSHAANLLLRAHLLDAQAALRIGVYQEVVTNELLWAKANEIAKQCAQSSPEALGLTKRLLNETIGEQLSTLLSAGAAAAATARTTEAAAEGVSAFLEKRAPQWP